jgi:hypothetical protein
MGCADAIELIDRYIARLSMEDISEDRKKDLLVGLSRSFSVLNPDEKNCVLISLVGKLVNGV